MDTVQSEKLDNYKRYVLECQIDEQRASGTRTTDTLQKLNVTLDSLPQKCQKLINDAASYKNTLGIENLEPIMLSQISCAVTLQKLDDNYEILILKQRNKQLQSKIDRNREEIEFLRKGLDEARNSLNNQSPNPNTIDDEIRIMKQKVASYMENCEKVKTKFSKLNVPPCLHPQSMNELVDQLTALREREMQLKQKADDIMLTIKLRKQLHTLRM